MIEQVANIFSKHGIHPKRIPPSATAIQFLWEYLLTDVFLWEYVGCMIDVRTIRKDLGLSQVQLAGRLGVRQSTISKLENGSLMLDERTRLALEALKLGVSA